MMKGADHREQQIFKFWLFYELRFYNILFKIISCCFACNLDCLPRLIRLLIRSCANAWQDRACSLPKDVQQNANIKTKAFLSYSIHSRECCLVKWTMLDLNQTGIPG